MEKIFYNCTSYFVTRVVEAEKRIAKSEYLTKYAHDIHKKLRAVANNRKVMTFNRKDQLFEMIAET